tara:strand:+ start:1501 stop:2253 length:753 start_codon:yes stop_codon:yes gene_type:complete
MIICNSNNFAVTRAQKTGGVSLEMYFLESGLVDTSNDIYTLEGGFANWEEFKAYSDAHDNLKYSELPRNLYGYDYLKEAQKTYAEIIADGQAPVDMPWVGTIRHPLKWLASLYYYANVRRKITATEHFKKYGHYLGTDLQMAREVSEPDASFDFVFDKMWDSSEVQDSLKTQTSYYPEHVQLFNIENIHEHATAFITAKGGSVTGQIETRKSDNDPTYYMDNLSDDRKQRALDIYANDLAAWEKAYAVYN